MVDCVVVLAPCVLLHARLISPTLFPVPQYPVIYRVFGSGETSALAAGGSVSKCLQGVYGLGPL